VSDFDHHDFTQEDRDAQARNTSAVEDLIAANAASNATMINLVERVQKETEARGRKVDALEKSNRQTRWVIALVCFGTLILIVLGIINATNLQRTRQSQEQLAQVAVSVDQANKTLLDCVNSTGQCGQVNSTNQAKILDTVKLYELTVIYCARTNPATTDPKGDRFVQCVYTLYPSSPKLNRQNQ
jgi:hypothetical protein